jgi:hypothetical protein
MWTCPKNQVELLIKNNKINSQKVKDMSTKIKYMDVEFKALSDEYNKTTLLVDNCTIALKKKNELILEKDKELFHYRSTQIDFNQMLNEENDDHDDYEKDKEADNVALDNLYLKLCKKYDIVSEFDHSLFK